MDRDESWLFLLVTHVDVVGAAPLGAFLCTTERSCVIKRGLQLIMQLAGSKSFFSQLWPTVVMTDDSAAEVSAVKELWPDTTPILCSFHTSQAYSRWLMKVEHDVPTNCREEQYRLFQKMLYAAGHEEFQLRFVL